MTMSIMTRSREDLELAAEVARKDAADLATARAWQPQAAGKIAALRTHITTDHAAWAAATGNSAWLHTAASTRLTWLQAVHVLAHVDLCAESEHAVLALEDTARWPS